MQGIKERSSKLYYHISLEDVVPADHELRRLHAGLDLRFLYKLTRPYYGKEGQMSIDPVVFFKMCLVGFLYNIPADRALARYCSDSLAARWFLHYDFDEALPVHSTLSRTRKLLGEHVFEHVFQQVLALCVDKGLVNGSCQIVDSALSKANASMDSLQRKALEVKAKVYCQELEKTSQDEQNQSDIAHNDNHDNQDEPTTPPQPEQVQPCTAPLSSVPCDGQENGTKPKARSNEMWFSPTDSDARIAFKPNKPKVLYYRTQVAIDSSKGVITSAFAQHADQNDHECIDELLRRFRTVTRLHHLKPTRIVADSGYSTSKNLGKYKQAEFDVWMPNPPGFKSEREGFTYHEQTNCFTCTQGNTLNYKSTRKCKKGLQSVYVTQFGSCSQCAIASACGATKLGQKNLYSTPARDEMLEMEQKLATAEGVKMMRMRKASIEPVLGNLLHYYGLRKIWPRGIASATKQITLACAAYNLRKWLRAPVSKHVKGVFHAQKTHIALKDLLNAIVATFDRLIGKMSLFQVVKLISS